MQAFTGGVLGTVIVGVRNGMGKHQDYQSASELTTLVKVNIIRTKVGLLDS